MQKTVEIIGLGFQIIGRGQGSIDRQYVVLSGDLDGVAAVIEQGDVAIVQITQEITNGPLERFPVQIGAKDDLEICLLKNLADMLGVADGIRQLRKARIV